jgi:hypothetical protein
MFSIVISAPSITHHWARAAGRAASRDERAGIVSGALLPQLL